MFKKNIKYPTGALKSRPDVRNIKLSRIAKISYDYPSKKWIDTTMIPTFNQKNIGACVGMAHGFNDIFQNYIETGEQVRLSPRYLYSMAKKVDGYSGEGTFPEVVLKINKEKGCATENTVPNNCDLSHSEFIKIEETKAIAKDAYPYRSGGYVQVNEGSSVTEEELKNALDKYGIFPITISVGNYDTNIKKGSDGYHRVLLCGYGYDKLKKKDGVAHPSGTNKHRFFFKNSWGDDWGVQGYGWFDFKKQEISDCFIQTDIPNEILEEAKQGAKVVITREITNSKETLGSLVASYGGKTFKCKTLELPWLNNKVNVSCIPTGQYVCKWVWSIKYNAYVFKILDVPGRTNILGHIGNFFSDILGCILLGEKHVDINYDGIKDVTNSRVTLKRLYDFFGGVDFTLVITK